MLARGRSALPVLFVLMWCGGYVFGSIGTKHAAPLAFTFWRFVVAATVLAAVALITRAPWPRTSAAWRSLILTGLSMQALFYSTGYLGMSLGVPAGLSALIGGLSPLAVAAAGSVFLNERLSRRQWAGSLLGVAGVVLAVLDRLGEGRIGVGVAFTLLGSVGFTVGTLLQRRHGAGMDLRTGGAVQFGVAALAVLPVALVHGGLSVPLTAPVLGPLAFVSLGNSVGATSLLFVLLRRQYAANATSLLYLVPPITALVGAAFLSQPLGAFTWAGLVIATCGVLLTKTRTPRPAAQPATARTDQPADEPASRPAAGPVSRPVAGPGSQPAAGPTARSDAGSALRPAAARLGERAGQVRVGS